ncbi:MAG: DUF3450 family protein [Candidatus Omnitrophota bacterium]
MEKSLFRSRKLATGSLVLACAVFFLSSGAISADKNVETIENTQSALEKWVETRRIISLEKRDLALAKEMLNERIDLVQREIDSLRGKKSDAEKSIAEADKKRAGLIEENEKLKEALSSLGGILASLEDRTKQLLNRLPDPIRERVKPLSQRIPEDANQSKLSVSERFQNVVGILNEVDKFNRDITVASEVRVLPDGSSAEVAALYIGIGQAYYAGANGTVAGVGLPSEEGWIWKPANDAAAQIAETIAILKNEKIAAFVQLPVEIQ